MTGRARLGALLVAGLGALGAPGCEAPHPEPSAPPGAGAATTSSPATTTSPGDPPPQPAGEVTWVERVPEDAGAASLPLIVAVHGLGDAPDRFCRLFDDFRPRARIACPRAFAPHGNGFSWFPLGGAGADKARAIGVAADRLATAITTLARARNTAGRPIVTGFSQGGAISFAIAVRHPTAIALAVPVGGWLPAELQPAKGAAVAPILALHGEDDTRVPVGPTRAAVETLAAQGADARLQTFAGVGHAIPPDVRTALFAALEPAVAAASAPPTP